MLDYLSALALPSWLDNLPYHVKGCIIVLLGAHLICVIGAIFYGVRASKIEGGAGYKPPFTQDFKSKNR